jgi:hypothetical protein
MPVDLEQHGEVTDNPILLAILKYGNQLRYGTGSEEERVAQSDALQTPGIRDAAYYNVPATVNEGEDGPLVQGVKEVFDPAASERYNSAYRLGSKWNVPPELQSLMHTISRESRKGMAESPTMSKWFGVKPERDRLTIAEELGMRRGSESAGENKLYREIMSLFGG